MSFETIHAARHAHAAESFAPRDGIGLVAGPSRKRIRRFGAPTDEAVNLFLDVDGRWFHGVFRINGGAGQRKNTEPGLAPPMPSSPIAWEEGGLKNLTAPAAAAGLA